MKKIASEVKHITNSFGMNVAFVCKLGLKFWNILSSQAMVRHIHNSLTETKMGKEHYMTPREVTSGENPEYVFAPVPCFDMPKL